MRISSWNVLAPAYCVAERYPHSPPGWDDPHQRAALVVATVADLYAGADAVCLQEVDEDLAAAVTGALPGAHAVLAPHPHRRDATMVLTSRPVVAETVLDAGRMRAAVIDLDLDGTTVRLAAAHLEWSGDGSTGADQLDALASALDDGTADHRLIGMDANGSWDGPVCEPLRRRGWVATAQVPSALIGERGWLALDVIAADSGVLQGLEVSGETDLVPSLTWPSDHLAITTRFTPAAPRR